MSPIASRTLTIVSSATFLAFSVPFSIISVTVFGFTMSSERFCHIGSSTLKIFFISIFLQSMHPMPAVLQPSATSSCSSFEEKSYAIGKQAKVQGVPLSVLLFLAGSVIIVLSFCSAASGESDRYIALS